MSATDAPLRADLLLDLLPAAVLALSGDDRLRSVNSAAEELLGTSRRHLLGRPLAALLPADSPLFALLARARAGAQTVSERGVAFSTRRGLRAFLDVHVSPVPDGAGEAVVMLLPCSVAERVDRHLVHAGSGRSLAALAMLLAHEIKNPLSGIRGAAQLLEEVVPPSERPLLDLVRAESERVVRLVEEMETFADRRPVAAKPVNVHLVLEHVRRVAEAGFGRGVRFLEDYDPSLPPVAGERERLVQLFLNLVKNACEAGAGEVVLRTRYQHGLRVAVAENRGRLELPISVEVEDDGPGVPEELREKLFDPFVSGRPGGRGLGLALVATIAADHGGLVALVPREKGACFRVRLPAFREDGRSGSVGS